VQAKQFTGGNPLVNDRKFVNCEHLTEKVRHTGNKPCPYERRTQRGRCNPEDLNSALKTLQNSALKTLQNPWTTPRSHPKLQGSVMLDLRESQNRSADSNGSRTDLR
jgi:hypothetical protein